MLLLKQGYGVKDAYTVPYRSAKDQNAMMMRLTGEAGALRVTVDYLHRAIATALADGLENGHPPVPGLIEVARLCGLTGLRPEPKSTTELIGALASTAAISALSAQARGRLINASDEWWDHHGIVESWFEDSDAAHAVLGRARSPRSAETALWKWLETRRDWWARIIARAADVLETADEPDAGSFAACAMALIEGRALKNIPVMFDVHDQTIGAWVHDDAGLEPDVALEELAEEAPAPEKKGEFAKLLKGSGLTTDWIDGYLTSVVIAPEMIAPNRFLSPVLGPVMPELDPSKFQRFMDLLMMRAHAASDLSADADEFATVMAKRPRKALADWATGFTLAAREFRAAWPKKSMTPEDRWLLEIVADGPDATDMAEIEVLLARRQERNQP